MTQRVADSFVTDGAGWIHAVFLLEEENQPLSDDPSPAMLVTRVSERLSQAAFAIFKRDSHQQGRKGADERKDPSVPSLMKIAVYFVGAAALALTAISYIDPDIDGDTVTERKDNLLKEFDEDVLDVMESEGDVLGAASPSTLLNVSLSLLTGAYQALAELEGVNAFTSELDEDSEEVEELTPDELLLEVEQSWDDAREKIGEEPFKDADRDRYVREQIVLSLWQSALRSAIAGERLVERYEAGVATVS